MGVAALAGGASRGIAVLTLTWLVWCRSQFDAKRAQNRKRRNVHERSSEEIEKSLSGRQDNIINDPPQKDELDALMTIDIHDNIVLVVRENAPNTSLS